MSSEKRQFVEKILNNLKIALNLKSDRELSQHLGLTSTVVSAWRARGTLDLFLLMTKCKNISIDFLITGEGNMYLNERKEMKYSVMEARAGGLVKDVAEGYNNDENKKIIELEAQVSVLKDIIIKRG